MFPFEFTRPALLLLIVPIGGMLGVWFVRTLTDLSAAQRIASLIVRSCFVLLLVFALSGLTWLQNTHEMFVMFVADESFSIGDEARRVTEEFVRDAVKERGSNRTGSMTFSSTAGRVQDLETRRSDGQTSTTSESTGSEATGSESTTHESRNAALATPPGDATLQIAELSGNDRARRNGTNVAQAIETAAAAIPSGYVPRIILLTDGVQTEGNAVAAAARAGVPVSTVALPSRSEPEVQVSEVRVPAEVREGEPFFVDVTVSSNHDDEGLLEIFRGDHKVVSERKTLKSGENHFRFEQSVDRDRMAAFKVRISSLNSDTLLDNNADSGLVYTAGKPRVLIIESDPELIRDLAYALEDEGIPVDIRPPQGMPDTLAGLQNYELVMISNVPATALSQQQMEIVRTYVQELGGGLLMLGGEQSFGLGGYYKSILEELLPVRSDFEKEKEKPSLGMVLVIDRSGSMDGDKLEMAKAAARSAVDLLGNRDQIAVLAFDDQTHVVSEMQSASGKGKISEEIASIAAGGGTSMYPAMELAFQTLSSTASRLKHVIMLTDGISNSGNFEALAQQMAAARMTVSTVAIGGEDVTDTTLLESIARIGKGRFYLAEDPGQVPQIFARETMTASKSAIDEEPFLPQVIRATRALAEIDFEAAPFLLGYVTTRPKPTSEVILATEKGDPLLAWWRYGLGMTGAFTSDAKSRWAAEWLTWPGYGKFWTQVVRQIMRKDNTRGIQMTTTRDGQWTRVTVDAVNDAGQFLNQSSVELTVINPRLAREKITLKQSAPGRYEATLLTQESGAYNIEISVKHDQQVLSRQSRGLIIGYSEELRIRPANESLLQDVARVSGGKFNPAPADVFQIPDQTVTRPEPLWPSLLMLASFLLVIDVALRRIDLSLHFSKNRQRLANSFSRRA